MHNRLETILLTQRIVTTLLVTAATALWVNPLQAQGRPKTDVVILKNGDRITGEIKSLQAGRLALKTDWMGTLDIEWDNIERVKSSFRYTVELRSGMRVIGSLDSGEEIQTLAVARIAREGEDATTVAYRRVVEITPLEETFWQRMKGSADLGFSFAQGNQSTQWSLDARTDYRTDKYLATATFSSLLQDQEGGTRTTRNQLTLGYQWFLGDRWYAIGIGQFQQNESQGLDLRGLLGGGIGRHVYRSTKTDLAILGGLDISREKYTGEEFVNSGEAIAGLTYETFRFESPKTEIVAHVFTFPNLSTLGRVRLLAEGRVRFEVIKDLYFSVNLYNIYDSDPPIEDVAKNDFSISTSLGWTF